MNNFWKSFLCVLACIFLCVASFFTGYFFSDTVKIKQSSEINALCSLKPADTVSTTYSYTSSNFPILMSFYNTNDYTDVPANSSDTQYVPMKFYFNSRILGSIPRVDCIVGVEFAYGGVCNNYNYVDSSNIVYDSWAHLGSRDLDDKYVFIDYNISSSFNFDIKSVVIETITNYSYIGEYATAVTYYDSSNNMCKFQFVFNKAESAIDCYMFYSRRYYLATNFTDNDFFNQGYTTGYDNGVAVGKTSGFNTGYNDGYEDGVVDGYNDGVNATNSYSFSNLLTAVVNAPISVFTNLLDFNIMGFNLLSLVAGLLTLGLIVLIIKLCLGGK